MPKIDHSKILIQPAKGKSTCQIFTFFAGDEALPDGDYFFKEKETSGLPPRPGIKLFGLIEANLPPTRRTSSLINSLIQEIKFIKIPTSRAAQKSPDAIFEILVQKINYKFIELLGNKSFTQTSFDEPPLTTSNINAILALISERDVYIAQRGNISPFLIYQTKPKNYKIISIADQARGQEGRPTAINLFTNIINGKININDYLLLTTDNLLDYFSLEKLCRLISAAPPEEATKNLQELLLGSANPQTTFAAIVIQLKPEIQIQAATPMLAATAVPEQISMPQRSMAELLTVEATTEKFLTPSLRLNLGEKTAALWGNLKNLFSKGKKLSQIALPLKKSGAAERKTAIQWKTPSAKFAVSSAKFIKTFALVIWAVLRTAYFIAIKIVQFIWNFGKNSFYLTTNLGGKRKTTWQNIKDGARQKLSALKARFNQLPRLSRILLVAAIIFGVLFMQSTALLYKKYRKESGLAALNQKMEEIQNKKSAAEASLLYNDEEGANKLLREAENLLAQFPRESKNEKIAYDDLEKQISPLREKLRHTVAIENPVAIANFANRNPEARVNEILAAEKNLYAFDRQSSIIYKVNLETEKIINKSASGYDFTLYASKDQNTAFFFQPENKMFSFDLQNDILRPVEMAFGQNEKVADFAFYNQNLYVLDAESGQIFKHSPAPLGFGSGTPWLKDGTDIRNASSMAVDGSIYLAKSDLSAQTGGQIIKFGRGKKVDFSPAIDPPLASPTKIWTSDKSSFVYILEPAGKRLIVIDKEGKLKAQYVSEQFDNLKDFAVLEKEKEIYLLNGTQIFGIIATHL